MQAVTQSGARVRVPSAGELVSFAVGTLLLIGLALRCRGYLIDTISLWEDEAGWAMRLMTMPVTKHAIRPLGFMAVTKLLATLLSPSEAVLRTLPWLGGVGTLLISPALARRLFSSAGARLLFIAVVALHPGAIDLAKEFKPYSVSLFLHLTMLWLTLSYLETKDVRQLAGLLALLFVGTLFAQDVVFAYPAAFGLLLFDAWRGRSLARVAGIVAAALATVALLGVQYVYFWRSAVHDGDRSGGDAATYWGNKYDVFYVAHGSKQSALDWTAERLGDMLAMPGMRRETWHSSELSRRWLEQLSEVDVRVWQVLAVLGAVSLLYRKRYREGLLVISPLVLMIVCNRLGFWPLGAFRTNLFVLAYALPLAAAACDRWTSRVEARELIPAGILVLAPFFLLDPQTHAHKTSSLAYDSEFKEGVRAVSDLYERTHKHEKPVLVLDRLNCAPFRYYTQYHPQRHSMKKLLSPFDVRCAKGQHGLASAMRAHLRQSGGFAYVLVGRARSFDEVEKELPDDLEIDAETRIGRSSQLAARIRSAHRRDAQDPSTDVR